MRTSITVPSTLAVLSRTPPIFLDVNSKMPKIAAAVVVSIPNIILRPIEAPPILPILKANPPREIKNATIYPRPGNTLFAIS